MKEILKASIDVTVIDRDALVTITRKSGKLAKFLNISIIPTPDNEHNSHVIVQDLGKDEHGNWIKGGPILGNVRRRNHGGQSRPAQSKPQQSESTVDDVPF